MDSMGSHFLGIQNIGIVGLRIPLFLYKGNEDRSKIFHDF